MSRRVDVKLNVVTKNDIPALMLDISMMTKTKDFSKGKLIGDLRGNAPTKSGFPDSIGYLFVPVSALLNAQSNGKGTVSVTVRGKHVLTPMRYPGFIGKALAALKIMGVY